MVQDDRPVYLRLRDQISAMILDGTVRDGDPLPSVRALAQDFGVNPLTVAKAYQSFQAEGLIVVRRGVGMFVAPGASAKLYEMERRDFLEKQWPVVLRQIKRLGFEADELLTRTLA